MVISPFQDAAIIYGATIGLLAVGFRLTQSTSGYMNLGHTVNLGVGMATGFIVIQQLNTSPMFGVPLAFLLTGVFNVVMYRVFYQKMEQRNYSEVLTSLFGLAFMVFGVAALYIATYQLCYRFPSDYWCGPFSGTLSMNHLHYRNPGAEAMALYVVGLVLFYLVNKTRLGLQFRAIAENQSLTEICGINSQRVRTIAWFIAGGLAGIARIISPYAIKGEFGRDAELVFVPVVLGSVIVEKKAVWIAGLTGLIVGYSQIFIVNRGQAFIGVWFGEYWNAIMICLLWFYMLLKDRKLSLNRFNQRKPLSSLDQP
jgi:branched-subunit amino acid ABC-type transport system permease component